ncbi:MAG: ZIP family metal transporter [Patescibacteria group bacterium]
MFSLPAFIFAIAAFFSTALGGLFSIKYKDKLHLIMGFSAGVLIGVVAFDIFPEIIEQVKINEFDALGPMIALVLGFFIFHILEKSIVIHHAHEDQYADHKHPHVGVLSAIALAGHSFLDGVGIGLGFQINPAIGIFIAIAVIAHSFTDGMNNIALMLTNKNTTKKAKLFLLLHATAPILGVLSTLFFAIPARFLILYLGFFAGFLLYIGASDILPEAHSKHSSYKTIALSILGVIFIFLISRFA